MNCTSQLQCFIDIPKEVRKACEDFYFKLDENGETDVHEVVVKASTKEELAEKLGHVQHVSPEYIVLNGKVRKSQSVFKTYFDGKL